MPEPTSTLTPPPAATAFAEDLGAYIAASPSSFHAVAQAAHRLAQAGFTELREDAGWQEARGAHYVIRDGAIIAWLAPPGATPLTPLHIFGTHTDSPALKLKPQSTTGAFGWLQAGVEIYGGGLLNSWLDRELELAGRLVTRDGATHLTRTGPLLRIPQLAPHLDRSVNDSLTLDRQYHMNPVWGLGNPAQEDLLGVLAGYAGVDPALVGGYDIVAVDTQPAQIFGAHNELMAAARMDNLLSTHAGLRALLATAASPIPDAGPIAMLAAFDHEEIGSQTRSGAAGSFLEDVLVRLAAALAPGVTQADRLRGWAQSWCVSCDVGHSIHPNYPGKHDPVVQPLAGRGPMLKVNANQRYVTDAVGAAAWQEICRAADVPCQEFVSNNSSPCGSTIGPMTAARLGIRTVDVGVPILSMHSARELCAVVDPWYLSRAAEQYFRG